MSLQTLSQFEHEEGVGRVLTSRSKVEEKMDWKRQDMGEA